MSDKTRFIERMKAELTEWETRIDELKVQAALGKMEAREDLEAAKTKLRAEVDSLRARLKEVSEDTSDAWDDLAAGLGDAWEEAKGAIRSAVDRYRS